MKRNERFLVLYSAAVTATLVAVAVSACGGARSADFLEITVQRINVVEPDGTLRLVVSNHQRLPGILVRGEEQPLDRPQAGMLFYNDEGSETGGLIFGGRKDAAGRIVDSGASLSFDRYEANQVVSLYGVDDDENRFAGLSVADSPSGSEVHRRVWLGRDDDGVATLALKDGAGRDRLQLAVAADGNARVDLLDADGSVLRSLLPAL